MESMLYNIFGQGASLMVEGLQPSELASQPPILLQDLIEEAKLKKEACKLFIVLFFCHVYLCVSFSVSKRGGKGKQEHWHSG
jgi:hypothetical protein